MKKFMLFGLLLGLQFNARAQLFSQNFSSSATVADYVNSSPNFGQFTAISNLTNNQTSINAGLLRFSKTGASSGYFARNSIFSGPPSFVKVSFDFTLSGNTNLIVSNNLATFFIGETLLDGATDPANSAVHSKFAFSFNNSNGSFFVRKLISASNGPNSYSGKQIITFIINNSGAGQSYISPNGASENISNDTWDLWVGNTKEFDDIAATTASINLSSFRFSYPSASDNATLDFDNFVITELTVLPISLTSFTGKAVDKSVILAWNTASEVNNDSFDVQHSADGKIFTSIGMIKGAGNSSIPKNYFLTDENPFAGTNYYKLVQHDFDGKTFSTNVISVDSKIIASQLSAYVSTLEVNIILSSPIKTKGKLHLFDISGKKLAENLVEVSKGINSFSLPVGIQSGIHFLRYTSDSEIINYKFSR